MTTSPDHPELAFVQARYYSRGRGGRRPLWIVVHDMEAGESSTRAENTAEYFRTMLDGRTVSSHYTADSDSVIQCVLLADTAFTVGNTPGNTQGINWEFSGFARQTRAEWLDAFGLAMFRQAAPIIRADAARFNIPLRRCSVADLKAFRPGVTSHNDLRLAFGGTSHTDPGPNFPWDVFMSIITGEDDEVTPDDINKIKTAILGDGGVQLLLSRVEALISLRDPYGTSATPNGLARALLAIADKVDIDPTELDAIRTAAREGAASAGDDLVAAVLEQLPGGNTLTKGDVEAAVRAVFADAATE